MEKNNGQRPEVRPNLKVERQANGAEVVRASTDVEVRAALVAGLPFTLEPRARFGTSEVSNGNVLAVARTDSEVADAVLSGLPYALPGKLRRV